MGFRFKVFPGVRVRVSSRGMGVGVGPRVARMHVSNRGFGVSTGIGPFSAYQHLGGGTRRAYGGGRQYYVQDSVAAYQRQARLAQRSAGIAAVAEVDKQLDHLQEVHLHEFSEVQPPPVGGGGFASQAEADAAWDALHRNEPAAVIASIERAFQDNDVPAAAVGCESDEVMLLMTLGEPNELIPDRCAGETPGGKPTIHKRTKTEINEEYAYLLASNVLATLKEAFACAPSVNRARIVVITQATADSEHLFTPIYCAAFARDDFASTNWQKIDPLEKIEEADEALIAFYGRTDEMVPIHLTDHDDLANTLTVIAGQLGLALDPESAPEGADTQGLVAAEQVEKDVALGASDGDEHPTPNAEQELLTPEQPTAQHIPQRSENASKKLRPLIEALNDPDSDVRYNAMSALGDHLAPSLLSTIEPLLRDGDKYIRRFAITYYARINPSDTVARLRAALHDDDADVRYNAMSALGDRLEPRLLSTIEPLLHDKDDYIRRFAVEYYGRLIS